MSEEKKGFFARLKEGLNKTRNNIVHGIDSVFSGFSAIDDEFYEELEEILIMGDIGVNEMCIRDRMYRESGDESSHTQNQRRQGGSKMADYVKVAVDAMGGDNAPAEIVKGAVEAIQAEKKIKVFLVGKEEQVKAELAKYTYPQEQVEVVNATEVIAMAEPPVAAIRSKKDSSIVKGLYMVREGKCDAFVSAGSTGAVLAGGQVIVGRSKGVERLSLIHI